MAYVDRIDDVWRSTSAVVCGNAQVQEVTLTWIITQQGAGDSRLLLAQRISGDWLSFFNGTMPSNTIFIGTKISHVQTFVPYEPVIDTRNTIGGGGATTLPTVLRPVTPQRTELVGRAYRGRVYGFTPDSTQLTPAGNPEPTLMQTYQNMLGPYHEGVVVGGTTWHTCLFHRPKSPTAPIIAPTLIKYTSLGKYFGSQHRSGSYGRPNVAPW
jgi:hypothetical protein